MYELEDAHDHLGALIKEMQNEGGIEIESFSVDVAHVYAHLNRGWNSREVKGEMSESQWKESRSFPNDLDPLA